MEGPSPAAGCGLSCPMGRSVPGAVVRLLPGADAHGMTTGVAAPLSGAGLPGGGASAVAAAGLCPETEGEIGLSPETGTTNPQDLSPGPGVAPDLMTGSDIVEVELIPNQMIFLPFKSGYVWAKVSFLNDVMIHILEFVF